MWRHLFLCPAYLLAASLPLVFPAGSNLEYEYALLTAGFLLLLVPSVALVLPERHLPEVKGEYYLNVPLEVFWVFLVGPIVPILVGLNLFATGICPCSGTGYGFWMVLQVYPTWILAHALYHGILRARVRGIKRSHLALAIGAVYLVLLVSIQVTLWIHPQKRLVHLLAGFLHGPIYDDFIAVDSGIVLARTAHWLLASTLLFAVWLKGQTVLACTTVVFAGAWIVTAWTASKHPSALSGQDALDKLMPQTLAGDGFTLHYRVERRTSEDGEQDEPEVEKQPKTPLRILRLFRDAEFHVQELRDILKEKTLPHVHIYVYPNRMTKKLWFGGGATDVTDVRTPSIHITASSWPHPTLRHELVHALTSDIAYHGLGFHPNLAFVEGLAEALAPADRSLGLHEAAASIVDSGRLPPIEDLFSAAFWKESGSRAYTVAGSLLDYLIQEYGIEGVKRLYAGEDWEDAFRESQEATLKKWRAFVMSRYDKEKLGLYAEALFRHPGILADLCPHSKADYRRARSEGVFVRLRQPIGWDPDRDYLPWLVNLAPDDIAARLAVWKKEIDEVATDRFPAQGRIATWRETLARARKQPPKTLEDVEMAIIESDLARFAGDRDGSLKILSELKEVARQRRLGPGLERMMEARIQVEELLSPDIAHPWRMFLAGWRKAPPDRPGADAPWLMTYLRLRHDRRGKIPRSGLEAMLDSEIDAEISTQFKFEWYRMLGDKLMRKEAYESAARAFEAAAGLSSSSRKALMEEHARRARFYAEKGSISTAARASE